MIELERLPPPLPSLSPLQQHVAIERGQQAADGGVTVVVVAERCINGGGVSGEEWDPQAAPQATPQLTLQTIAWLCRCHTQQRDQSRRERRQSTRRQQRGSRLHRRRRPAQKRRLWLWIGKGSATSRSLLW